MTVARGLLLAIAVAIATTGCGGAPGPKSPDAARAGAMLPDVRQAKDRPPVVLVSREGDPASAVSVSVTTAGLEVEDDPEPAAALAGVVEARLAARGMRAIVTAAWDGYRAAVLASSAADARAAAEAIRAALNVPIQGDDLAGARKKLAALSLRPLKDAALARWARCVGSPFTQPARAGRGSEDLTIAKLEAWRAGSHALGRVAIGVAGTSDAGEAVAAQIAESPAWKSAPAVRAAAGAAGIDVDVYETSAETPWAQVVVHATLDVGTSSAAVATAEALGDPRGPLATRLAGLDVPFRLREVTGSAHARGGCVGVILEAAPTDRAPSGDLAARVADAVALLHVETRVHLAEGGALVDGRTLARRAGDAREASERASWWALADSTTPLAAGITRGSVALGVSTRRGSQGATVEPAQGALAAAVQRATAAWQKPVVEGRTRVEPGQGEAWVLFASPCGTDAEGDADAGLSALFTTAAAETAQRAPDAMVEPWVAPDGAGLLVHGPALQGETPAAHARRLTDVVARSFAAEALAPAAFASARPEVARRGDAALSTLASALAPGHPSWVVAWGREETSQRASDSAVLARAQAVRAGPLRVAVIANVDAAQGEAAIHAADRWIDRRGEARACRPVPVAAPPRPGTYAIEPRPGSAPEAMLAFPFAAGDEAARTAATTLAAALDGDGGLLERALASANAGLARAWSARVVGWPRAPALVVRITSTQAALDGAVMQVRALVDRLHKGGLAAADHDRATGALSRAALATALDPRARIVSVWRGETVASARAATAEEVRAFAGKSLGEDALVVVASRPGRPQKASP